jgi:hypothetical protein
MPDERCTAPATDAHHIESRDTAPDGGYVLSNGIALCEEHHKLAERDQRCPYDGGDGWYRPAQLRKWIGV